jgi:hypothetical protein
MANRSAIRPLPAVVGISGVVDWALLLILFLPSIYLLLTVQPLLARFGRFQSNRVHVRAEGHHTLVAGILFMRTTRGHCCRHRWQPASRSRVSAIVDKHNSIKRPWSLYARRVSTPAAGVLALLFRKNGYGSSIGETFVCGIFCADTVDVCLRQLHRERSIQQSPDLSCSGFGLELPHSSGT